MKLDLKKPKEKVFLVTFFRFVVRQCLFWALSFSIKIFLLWIFSLDNLSALISFYPRDHQGDFLFDMSHAA